MFQYTRLHELLKYFIHHKGYIDASTLGKLFQISERTLRNDIRNLNDEIQIYHAQVMMKRNEGYFLYTEGEQARLQLETAITEKVDYLDSADKRINHLIIKMLYCDAFITQDILADEVFVSTNTIINYLKTIRIILSTYTLSLQTKANLGYKIIGSELDKRRCIIDLITTNYHQYSFSFSKEQIALLDHVNLELIKEIVIKFNREHNVHFSDYNLKNLILHIGLSISRLLVFEPIEHYKIPANASLDELLDPLISLIEQEFEVQFGVEEKNYIYSHYISNTNELLNAESNMDYIHNLVENVTNDIYDAYHIDLRHDLILEKDLCHHLQSILNAKYYNLNKKNPLLNTIKNNYVLAYEISETALKQAFQNEPFTLTDDEIGYISLHIGAAIERYFDSRKVNHKKAFIVYDSGYAAGSFIASKLHTLFRDTLDIIAIYPSHEFTNIDVKTIDLVISTVALHHINIIPVVIIEIPLLRKDIESIARIVTRDDVHPIDKIAKFFDPELFINTQAFTKSEIIHSLCELLLTKGYVQADFEDSVIEREERVSTAMDGVVAIPHPLRICSAVSKIAVGILKKPVAWSNKDNAQIIIMLALGDDVKKDIEKLYDTFVAMMHNPPLQKLLFHAQSLDEFLLILKKSINLD